MFIVAQQLYVSNSSELGTFYVHNNILFTTYLGFLTTIFYLNVRNKRAKIQVVKTMPNMAVMKTNIQY